jgi:hypothetical protein
LGGGLSLQPVAVTHSIAATNATSNIFDRPFSMGVTPVKGLGGRPFFRHFASGLPVH